MSACTWVYHQVCAPLLRAPLTCSDWTLYSVEGLRRGRRRAGASLEHPHSQLIATVERPELVRAELERLAGPDCAACAVVKRERGGDRAVEEAGELLTICPWASSMPYESLLVPAAHLPRFEEGDTDGDLRIAGAIGRLLRRFGGVVGASAPYNLVLHSAPPGVSDFQDRKSTRLNSSHGSISY